MCGGDAAHLSNNAPMHESVGAHCAALQGWSFNNNPSCCVQASCSGLHSSADNSACCRDAENIMGGEE